MKRDLSSVGLLLTRCALCGFFWCSCINLDNTPGNARREQGFRSNLDETHQKQRFGKTHTEKLLEAVSDELEVVRDIVDY